MPVALPFERPLGAHPDPGADGFTFRVWAHGRERVEVELRGKRHPLAPEGHDVFAATLQAAHGDRYAYVLDGGEALPDPCSRWQPEGLRGPSAVVDPRTFAWTDVDFRNPELRDQVIYELHIGTFTAEGTFDAAIEHLPGLAELGVTAIEVMPVAEFPGRFGWGYDGVYLSAAHSAYGGPDGLHRLVDGAHAAGLAVILDVVYNHVGASGGKALEAFGPYFTEKYSTFWGAAINYDDEYADPVREWVLQSAESWIADFHVDGLRLDAIHAIYDTSARPVLREIAARVHGRDHRALVIAESGMNDPAVMRPASEGGLGHDAAWADDLHHAVRTLLTGDREGYYEEFGDIADLVKCLERPFHHDGTYSTFRHKRFGAPAGDRPAEQFVVFTQNHDQVGNRALGDRPPADLWRLAAFTILLSGFTPMLWQGEEYGEPAPFQFFADHIDPDIAEATREGRRREFASFAAFAGEEVPDPGDPATFERSKLTRRRDPAIEALYRGLLRVRRELPPGAGRPESDRDAKWIRVTRGTYEICLHLGAEGPGTVPLPAAGELVLATHPEATELDGSAVRLPPQAGALVRLPG